MRAISIGGSLVALVLMLGAGALGKDKNASSPDNSLVVGDGYILHVERHGVAQKFRGDVVKLTDRWIVLRRVTVSRVDRQIPVLATLPVVGAVFHTSIPQRHDEFCWIPRDAATVEKRIHAAKPAEIKPPDGDEPQTKVACRVELARGTKLIQREGGMQAVTPDSVTVDVTTTIPFEMPTSAVGFFTTASDSKRPKFRYTREQFAREDILCVRVPNFDSATHEALAR
jgi:hypothetical protein